MTTAVMPTTTVDAAIVERVLLHGDLRQLTPAQKLSYYNHVCESIGLNPLTKPFEYIVLNGKETLYAKRDATDQLRKIHNVSVQIVAREVTEDCFVVTARATLPTNRQDESIGAVPISNLKGEARANAMMKCETKAKRRVTLSICGLGMLDETEIDSIQHAAPEATTAPSIMIEKRLIAGGEDALVTVDTDTGEELPEPTPGYHYVTGYTFKNGWHEADLLKWDAEGGALHVSTRLKFVGALLNEAANFHIPAMCDLTMKKQTVGEAYVNKVVLFKTVAASPVSADEIAF